MRQHGMGREFLFREPIVKIKVHNSPKVGKEIFPMERANSAKSMARGILPKLKNFPITSAVQASLTTSRNLGCSVQYSYTPEINPKSRSLYTMSIVENLPSSSVRERDIRLISRVRQREESESSTSFLLRLFGFTYVSLLDSEA